MSERERFGIVADTASGISPEKGEAMGIGVVSIVVILGEQQFRDFVDITAAEVKRGFDITGEIPQTSGVNAGEFIEAYKKQLDGKKQIISIHISKNFSQVTHDSARTAAEILRSELELKENPVVIIDSGQAGPAISFLVEEAVLLRNQEVSFHTAVSKIREQSSRLFTVGTIARLDFLYKTGRVPFGKITIPLLQNAMRRSGRRPIIYIYNGEWDSPLISPFPPKFDWRRLPKKEEAMERMVELALQGRNIKNIEIFQFDAAEDAEKVNYCVRKKSDGYLNPKISESPASFTAAGPGFVGIAIETR